jgi:hypothetical protein
MATASPSVESKVQVSANDMAVVVVRIAVRIIREIRVPRAHRNVLCDVFLHFDFDNHFVLTSVVRGEGVLLVADLGIREGRAMQEVTILVAQAARYAEVQRELNVDPTTQQVTKVFPLFASRIEIVEAVATTDFNLLNDPFDHIRDRQSNAVLNSNTHVQTVSFSLSSFVHAWRTTRRKVLIWSLTDAEGITARPIAVHNIVRPKPKVISRKINHRDCRASRGPCMRLREFTGLCQQIRVRVYPSETESISRLPKRIRSELMSKVSADRRIMDIEFTKIILCIPGITRV